MNKQLSFILVILFSFSHCLLDAATKVEVRAGALYPCSSKFKQVYGHFNYDYQVELSTTFKGPYEVWTNFDWFSKTRHKHQGCECKTSIKIPTISTGLKYLFPLGMFQKNLNFYLGIGLCLDSVYLKNRSCYSKESWRGVSAGGVVKSGLTYTFYRNLFLDLFADYTYQPIHLRKHCQVGGIKFGLGLGAQF